MNKAIYTAASTSNISHLFGSCCFPENLRTGSWWDLWLMCCFANDDVCGRDSVSGSESLNSSEEIGFAPPCLKLIPEWSSNTHHTFQWWGGQLILSWFRFLVRRYSVIRNTQNLRLQTLKLYIVPMISLLFLENNNTCNVPYHYYQPLANARRYSLLKNKDLRTPGNYYADC